MSGRLNAAIGGVVVACWAVIMALLVDVVWICSIGTLLVSVDELIVAWVCVALLTFSICEIAEYVERRR